METVQLTLVFICFCSGHKALAENSDGLLLHRFRNLEKQLDLHLKTMKSELRRDVNNGNKRNTDTDELLNEIRQVQTSIQELSRTTLNTLSMLSIDVRSLASIIESMQDQIAVVDNKVSDLSRCGEVPVTAVPTVPVITATPQSEHIRLDVSSESSARQRILMKNQALFSSKDIRRVRLVGGSDHSGTVEINVEGRWGTICDDDWDLLDANIVCRMLGFSGAENAFDEAYFGEGTGDILLDGINCMGNESSIFDCAHYGIGNHDCSHPEDAGVICSNGGQTTPIPTPTLITTPSSFPISYRLVDGPTSYAGRVEVFYDGEWGTVCDDGFDEREALVLCNHLGIRGGTPKFYDEAFYGHGSGPILMDDLDCAGFESSLEFCSFRGWGVSNCGHGEDVGVDCHSNSSSTTPGYTTTTTEAPVLLTTLVDGPNNISGRVEVYHDGVWGTVCDDDFGDKEAAVVCRSLGSSGGKAYKEAAYGQGIGPVWMDDVHCTGEESSLGGCMFSGWNSSNCGHDEDVAVECESASTHPKTIRLVGGAGPWEGRVEVYLDNEWGTVCSYNWDDREAEVVCRMLGLKGGKAFSGSKYGPGSDTLKLASYGCTGKESTIFNCSYWDSRVINSCGHDQDASVECMMPLIIDGVYLVGGRSENVGRVEITINGVTGTICDDHFDNRAATVLCRMLGYTHGGESYIEARYGEGSGQVILDDVKCNGDETSLTECSYRELFTSNCEHDEDVSVKCFSEVITGSATVL